MAWKTDGLSGVRADRRMHRKMDGLKDAQMDARTPAQID